MGTSVISEKTNNTKNIILLICVLWPQMNSFDCVTEVNRLIILCVVRKQKIPLKVQSRNILLLCMLA